MPKNKRQRLSATLRSIIGFHALACLLIFAAADAVRACSVPVFRYALERWAPDPFALVVFHRGELSGEQRAWVDGARKAEDRFANANVKTVDLDADPEAGALDMWKAQEAVELPWMVLVYPWKSRLQEPAWSGAMDGPSVEAVIDSPVRRQIARRLLQGESAVWVLLESGDEDADDQAVDRLARRLKQMESELELPDIADQDIADGLISVEEEELRIAFSMIRVSRGDPEESVFVNMLLGTESDLRDFEEPIAFPIYGRGRALYALIGKGINDETIQTACAFLVGSCSCQVKEDNPGVDLLMAVDWEHLVQPHIDLDRELPPLSGFASFADAASGVDTETSQKETGDSMPDRARESSTAKTRPAAGESREETGMNPVVRNSLVVLLMGGLGVIGAGIYYLRK